MEDTLPEALAPCKAGILWGENAHSAVKSLAVTIFYDLKYNNSLCFAHFAKDSVQTYHKNLVLYLQSL